MLLCAVKYWSHPSYDIGQRHPSREETLLYGDADTDDTQRESWSSRLAYFELFEKVREKHEIIAKYVRLDIGLALPVGGGQTHQWRSRKVFLKSLTIENPSKEETVQNIKFRKGINLIVDTTNPEDIKESGNNVGKTTVLRLIDFCLGGDGKNIYRDREFKERETNTVVKNFLENSNIIITLVLKENLDNENSSEIKIRRNFLSLKGKSGILEIEGKHYSSIVGIQSGTWSSNF